ncbi:YggS family pyridoxal phosphate-dependent enzyme [Marinobacter nanhaiticus D15-8W]|uniref:Pyridoxal phosphate homeostasis protein n=1 Tax=Marinobacter nanhaiticus D15-8W TaxID=626887 RepID=N6WT19_9GAMM|nr:YggS family pyridoxal phosphate-dependent enzyme [Marinobacter nanhaiticus]ENO14646.1 YggS family pyridoxal phosphate-dependent enzyme [Marinobacter nanhaiticus D15-8W]BES69667.1 YggS family pyridoxal phosphate-dependent enzyme [Marinobacter nanhaiticus D15-8W]
MGSIADNIGGVTRRIQKATKAANRPPESVRLLAVSKRKPPEDIRAAAAAGQLSFGENYVQEALEKMAALADLRNLEWHFIGPIQSNKTRDIAAHFDWVHSVDRLKIARRLSDQRPESKPPLNICLQVNVDNEDTKAGATLTSIPQLAEDVIQLPGLRLRGLMAIPDPDQSEASLRESFRALATALNQLREANPDAEGLDTLSMGMSDDMETAIEEGATIVRVGTALFGARDS